VHQLATWLLILLGVIVTGAFAKKHWLFAWAHELTKNRRKFGISISILYLFALSHSLCIYFPAILESKKDRTRDKDPPDRQL
jgi:hypothetical protein